MGYTIGDFLRGSERGTGVRCVLGWIYFFLSTAVYADPSHYGCFSRMCYRPSVLPWWSSNGCPVLRHGINGYKLPGGSWSYSQIIYRIRGGRPTWRSLRLRCLCVLRNWHPFLGLSPYYFWVPCDSHSRRVLDLLRLLDKSYLSGSSDRYVGVLRRSPFIAKWTNWTWGRNEITNFFSYWYIFSRLQSCKYWLCAIPVPLAVAKDILY